MKFFQVATVAELENAIPREMTNMYWRGTAKERHHENFDTFAFLQGNGAFPDAAMFLPDRLFRKFLEQFAARITAFSFPR